MPKYFYKNIPVPESQLLRLAEEGGMSLEEFLEATPGITTEDVSVEEEEKKEVKKEEKKPKYLVHSTCFNICPFSL